MKKEGKMREEIDKKVLSECSCNYIIDGDNKVKTIKVVRLDFDKCYELMHDDSVPKTNVLRWGSIFKAETIEEISDLLGDDLLTMEEKERFLNSIRAVNSDEEIKEIENKLGRKNEILGIENTEKFLNQVSDYSYSLSRKNIYNESSFITCEQ